MHEIKSQKVKSCSFLARLTFKIVYIMGQTFSGKLIPALYLCVKKLPTAVAGAIKFGAVSLCPLAITFKHENELHF